MFNAILIDYTDNEYNCRYAELDDEDLPSGNVTVDIEYSSINYKDALAITGKGKIVRSFPMIAGVDLAGIVEKSEDARFIPGDKVMLSGWGVGEKHWGGLAQKARVCGNWLTHIPEGMTTRKAMSFGIAGFTAMLCVESLIRHGIEPGDGPVLVTGANGGVGSYAIAILSALGYRVTASTGRPHESDYLLNTLGAVNIIHRDELSQPGKALQEQKWSAAIDTVGSDTLYNACASVKYGGVVAACGMAQGLQFHGTVAPFIIRNVTLAGIDSVMYPQKERHYVWTRINELVGDEQADAITRTCRLDEVIDYAKALIAGEVRGRTIVDCRA
ncbi:zinc-binding dehydrogenase [Yersinia enterocolitica]|uniref:acrylyl-CoA reductase (NADPH) n=1 Tax=Yersinia enterocolitica TaxID=630 RepID=UPI0005DE6470|nr:MDR family oxidoreductase [Yersinia enterocolitica]CNG75399.1 zinc-binding dehydrogenase [Yersinia enterocolitica]